MNGHPHPPLSLEAATALAESERNFRTFFDTVSDFLFILDLQGQILHINRAAEQRLGYTKEQLQGRSVLMVHPAARREEAAAIVAAMLAGSTDHCPVPLQTIHGELIPVETHIVVGQWSGQPALLGFSRDLSRLAASEEKFAKTFQLSPIAMALTLVSDSTFIEVNEAFSAITGYTPDQVIGRSAQDIHLFVNPADRSELLEELLQQGRLRNKEIAIRCKDGTVRYGLFSAGLIQLQDQQIIVTQMLDITERKQVEADLKAERDLFVGGPVAILIWNKERSGLIHYASHNIKPLFGWSAAEMMTENFHYAELIHPEDRALILQDIEHHLTLNHLTWEQHYRGVRADGAVRRFYDFSVVEWDTDGKVKLIRSYLFDESERIQVNERLRLAAAVFEYAHEGIMICDAKGDICEVNPTFSELTGYRADEVVGKNPRILSSGRHDRIFYNALWQQIEQKGYWRGEIWDQRKDGTRFASLMTISAIYNAQRQVTHYFSVFSDVTQLKLHQERLDLLAHYDTLTHLPNRVLLADRMQQAMVRAQRKQLLLAIAYLDLDGFKPVNDRYGHEAGDRLLVTIAKRLQETLRSEDTVARIGGDEFVLLLGALTHRNECQPVIDRLLTRLAEPIQLSADAEVQVSGSIGISLYPSDGLDADLLLRQADQAMYQAKLAGRHCFRFYQE